MSFKFNPFTGTLDLDSGSSGIPTAASDPAGAVDGQQYINTSTNEYKIYFCGSWQTIFTFTCAPPTSGSTFLFGGFLPLPQG